METRKLGQSDLELSVAGLGCNNFGWFLDKERSLDVITAALDAGINFFDTANNYGMPAGESERILGEALAHCRKSVIITTKVGDQVDAEGKERGGAPAYVRQAVEQSLRNLKTDYIDLYQLHYPDPEVPIADTLGAMGELVQAGKVRFIGCANHSATQLSEALDASRQLGVPAFVSCQNEYSLIAREIETELVPLLRERGVGFLPYFPLANGLLTGKYRGADAASGRLETVKNIPFFDKFLTEERFAKVDKLAGIAESEGLSMVELALGWLKAQSHVTSIIAGATSPDQVRSNARASNGSLSAQALATLDSL